MYACPDLNPAKFCRGTPDPRYPSVDGGCAIDGFKQPTTPSVPSGVSAKLVDDPLAPTDSTFTSLPLHLTIRKRLGVTASPVAFAAKVASWKANVRPMPGPRSMETTTRDRTTTPRTLLVRGTEFITLSPFSRPN